MADDERNSPSQFMIGMMGLLLQSEEDIKLFATPIDEWTPEQRRLMLKRIGVDIEEKK